MNDVARYRTAPLKLKFVITSLPVGGAETLLLNLVRRLDRRIVDPEVVCLKEPGALGPEFSNEVALHSHLLRSKWDVGVLGRLKKLFRSTDAVITVGAGDKMFWGRLAARLAKVPVVASALHSTGWPDGVGHLNRALTGITDAFIAVAEAHADYLRDVERFPASKVHFIPNGVDTNRFRPAGQDGVSIRRELGIPGDAPLVGIVAALRSEKNHTQFLAAAKSVVRRLPNTHFLIVGDGPERGSIEGEVKRLGLQDKVHFTGSRSDTPALLSAMDVFCLTSRNEANPVSIMEALACEVPVIAPNVGSIDETVKDGITGFLTEPLNSDATANALLRLLSDRTTARQLGAAGRELIKREWSLDRMVEGYQQLVTDIYNQKAFIAGEPSFEVPRNPPVSAIPATPTWNSQSWEVTQQP